MVFKREGVRSWRCGVRRGTRRGPFIAARKAVTRPDFVLEELRAMAVGENIPPLTLPVRPRLGFAVE
jgi:hypothetical protein